MVFCTIVFRHTMLSRDCVESWMNAIGLILTSLPESYWSVILTRITEHLVSLSSREGPATLVGKIATEQLFNYNLMHHTLTDLQSSYLLALAHAIFHHSSIGQLSTLPQ